MIRLVVGNDPKLYGRTIDDKDFDWTSLRGKYVLVKFTATWCGPCKMEVPGMLEAYKKYKDKGLEIVSVYVFQREADPVATVKEFVAEEKLPWIILSEALTEKAKQPKQGEYYAIQGVPTMVLVDKEGKVIMSEARGKALQNKLAEIFK
jgi:thiol-disulfide isomerase/thioredoxin